MYTLVARNKGTQEAYVLEIFFTRYEAFDYAYKYQASLYEKGGWITEIKRTATGKLVEDDRLTHLA